jgi:hypothetical protein
MTFIPGWTNAEVETFREKALIGIREDNGDAGKCIDCPEHGPSLGNNKCVKCLMPEKAEGG